MTVVRNVMPLSAVLACVASAGCTPLPAARPAASFFGADAGDAAHPPARAIAPAMTAFETLIVEDAVEQLVALVPPAHTELAIQSLAGASVSQAFVSALRAEGYGVLEPMRDRTRRRASAPVGGLPLSFRMEELVGTSMTLVEMDVAGTRLSRLFIRAGDQIYGAGVWAIRERGK
ncbi:hypothetical protein EYV96_13515 [Dyella terrae]|uniref:Conjugal transfer protein TrbH n=2 Tax=Dyella TaxID=231454 RepID=A0A4R0YNU4_9GAMM|nr:hypothetical protein [Dyella soli]TBR36913.1 hypothetical protein EYV96_13515 [Dyella terrae]TCI07996.1 hypothetical protein EZM97_25355 [Dyella soli]